MFVTVTKVTMTESGVFKTWGPNTLNNYTAEELERVLSWGPDVARMTVAEEVGAEGTPHLQFTICFKTAKRLSALKKLCPRTHWVPTRNDDGAWLYVQKATTKEVHVVDNRTKKGERRDLAAAYDAAEAGQTMAEFLATRPGLQAIQVFKIRRLARTGPEWRDVKVTSVYGLPGSGKSRWAHAQKCADGRPPWVVVVSRGDICWDTYDGQDTILFDDYRPNQTDFAELLRILDGYPLELRCRYQNTCAMWTRVLFTSVEPIDKLWAGVTAENMQQLIRRMSTKVHVTEEVTVTEVAKGNTGYATSTVTPGYWYEGA